MRTPSDELFQLIKSMSKQEKRYFKLFAARHVIGEQNNYLLLFDEVDRQKKYDEAAIREKFRKQRFVRQLHVMKNYLFTLIMRSLRNFYASDTDDKFHDMLRDAQILYDKGLHVQSQKVLDRARKQALEHERFLQLLEIQRWEHTIIHQNNEVNKLERYASRDVFGELEFIDKYRNLLQFQLLNDRMFIQYWKVGIARNKEEKEQMARIFDDALYQSPENAKSFLAKYYYHNALFTYQYCSGQLHSSHETISTLVRMIESLDPDMRRYASKYISALNNLYAVQKELKLNDEAFDTLRKLRDISVKSTTNKAELFMRSYILELDLYISTGEFSKGIATIPQIATDFEKYVGMINKQSKLVFYYNFAYICFGAGNYNEALTWNNQLLNDSDVSTREDIHCFGRILNLIIHYELGNNQLLEYIGKSTYRFLYKRKRLFKVETVILNFIKKYPNWANRERIAKGFQELYVELEKLSHDDYEKHAFEYFDFLTWLESKIHKKDFGRLKFERVHAQVVRGAQDVIANIPAPAVTGSGKGADDESSSSTPLPKRRKPAL